MPSFLQASSTKHILLRRFQNLLGGRVDGAICSSSGLKLSISGLDFSRILNSRHTGVLKQSLFAGISRYFTAFPVQ